MPKSKKKKEEIIQYTFKRMLWFILPSCLQKPCLEIKLRMRLSMWIWRVVLVPSELLIFSVSRPQALLCGWREKARSGPQL